MEGACEFVKGDAIACLLESKQADEREVRERGMLCRVWRLVN